MNDPVIEEVIPKLKLSKHERNLIALSWLAEIILKSLVEEKNYAPQSKKEMYEYISNVYSEAYENAKRLNTAFEDEIGAVFSEDYGTLLLDVTNAVINLYETMTLEQMLAILKAAGVKTDFAAESYINGIKETKENINVPR